MTLDAYAIANALAAKYANGTLPGGPPSGLTRVRTATAQPPNGIRATPAVLVFPDQGTVDHNANGTRRMVHQYLVRFYMALAVDLGRDYVALERWLSLLLYAHLADVTLGGLVTRCAVTGYKVGTMRYGAKDYQGIELQVEAVTTEPWSPT